MRLFPNDKNGKAWDQNVMQKSYSVLLVSQFTLYGVLKGNKPDFHVAMPPQQAKPFYEAIVQKFSKAYRPDAVKDGLFGAMMQVHLVNDGPVTMQIDSRKSSASDSNSTADLGPTSNCPPCQPAAVLRSGLQVKTLKAKLFINISNQFRSRLIKVYNGASPPRQFAIVKRSYLFTSGVHGSIMSL
ncbi:hypothetical protein CY35_05G050300 [Sphagnum magellanicum]|nr:hypothetical protein CY35_05G050300 [Sphagnum magellanicum]